MTVYTNSKTGLPQPGLDAAREGRRVFGYVNAKTGINAEAVLTDATFLKTVSVGKRLVISSFHMGLSTTSSTVTVEFVGTEHESGAGEVTILSQTFQLASGNVTNPVQGPMMRFDPPIVVDRDIAHAFSARVLGNDAAAALYLGFYGWEEGV